MNLPKQVRSDQIRSVVDTGSTASGIEIDVLLAVRDECATDPGHPFESRPHIPVLVLVLQFVIKKKFVSEGGRGYSALQSTTYQPAT